MGSFPLGLNTYSIRALRWPDLPLLDYAEGLKLDAVYLQDSIDPGNSDPAHWIELKVAAARLGLELQGGDAGALPRTPDGMDATLTRLREGIRQWGSDPSWCAFAWRGTAPAWRRDRLSRPWRP